MSIQSPLADMLTHIRNAQMISKPQVIFAASQLKTEVCRVLHEEGYIVDYHKDTDLRGHPVLVVNLKYHENEPAIREIRIVSKPSVRRYVKLADLPKIYNGLGIAIISTSQGVLSDRQARQKKVCGEMLCTVF